jgi:hypothetical protein
MVIITESVPGVKRYFCAISILFGRRRCGIADHEFRWDRLPVVTRETALDDFDQHLYGLLANPGQWLTNGGQWRSGGGCLQDIVEADDRKVFRDTDATFHCGLKKAEGNDIIEAKYGCRTLRRRRGFRFPACTPNLPRRWSDR